VHPFPNFSFLKKNGNFATRLVALLRAKVNIPIQKRKKNNLKQNDR